MARIPDLETQIQEMTRSLRRMADRVLEGVQVIERHLEHSIRGEIVKLVVWDNEVDRLEAIVDDAILQIFATQQPLAYELRLTFASVKVASIIERMGDAVESLARQLAAREPNLHRRELLRMVQDTADLCRRSYSAMFEEDLGRIQEIHSLDDKVDAGQRELFRCARLLLGEGADAEEVDEALQLISLGSKLEKIADLACDWAEQIDFARNGRNRGETLKRKHRVVFLDADGGLSAGFAASALDAQAKGLIEVGVLSLGESQGSLLEHSELLRSHGMTLQLFPVGALESMRWKRTFMVITVGDVELSERQRDYIPFKSILESWKDVDFSFLEEADEPERFHGRFEDSMKRLKARVENLVHLVSLA